MSEKKYTIAVDFDGVIHSYTSPWTCPEEINDPPTEGAIEWLNEMEKKFEVVIFTTRAKDPAGHDAVRDWLREHGYRPPNGPEVTATKPAALIYLDDRAVRFDGTNFPTAEDVHRLRPWNKPLGQSMQTVLGTEAQ